MKKTTLAIVNKQLTLSLAKSQESTAILRSSIQLIVNEQPTITPTQILQEVKILQKFSLKTIKNCLRFAKKSCKDSKIKKAKISELIKWYMQDETRAAYDVCVNGNRHKTQEASKQEASKQEASKQEASKQEASKQEASKQEASKQEASKQEASAPAVHHQKNDIELFVDSLSLEELKQAYAFIRNRLGIKASEKTLKMINDIKQVAC